MPHVIAGGLALFLGTFVLWAIVRRRSFRRRADGRRAGRPARRGGGQETGPAGGTGKRRQPARSAPLRRAGAGLAPPRKTRRQTRRQTPRPSPSSTARPASAAGGGDPRPGGRCRATAAARQDAEVCRDDLGTAQIPKIARRRHAARRRLSPAPRRRLPASRRTAALALIVAGLGVSASATSTAIAQAAGAGDARLHALRRRRRTPGARARGARATRFCCRSPMEPFDYPDNDPGPQTLLTSLTPEQNLDRLHWLMSRLQGYVGSGGAMGARFTASEPALCADPARDGEARADLRRRRRHPAQRRRPRRRRQQSAVRQGRHRARRGADAGRDRPRARRGWK